MKYYVSGSSDFHLNDVGKAGAALFIGGTVLSAVFFWFYYSGLIANASVRYSFELRDVTWAAIAAGACAIGALFGFVLLLVGRTLTHHISISEA